MFQDPFWQSCSILLRYKRRLAVALAGALVSAACFGAGLGMLLPMFYLLLDNEKPAAKSPDTAAAAPNDGPAQQVSASPLQRLLHRQSDDASLPAWRRDSAAWLSRQLPEDPFRGFVAVVLVVGVLSVIGSTGRYVHQLVTVTITAHATLVWRSRLFHRLVHAQPIELLSKGYSDHVAKLIFDTRVLGQGYEALLGKTIAELLKGTAALTVAFWYDWVLTCVALIGAPLMAVLLRKFGKSIRKATKRAMQERGKLVAAMKESLGGILVVKVHSAEGYERRRFHRVNRMLLGQELKVRQAKALSGPVIDTLALFGVMAVATISAWYIFRRGVEAQVFLSVLTALGAAASSLKPLTGLHNTIHESGAAATRIFEALKLPVEPTGLEARRNTPAAPRHQRDITFEHASFAYPRQDRPAIRDVSLRIGFGQTVAFVGPNGSGKTTLLSLLTRVLTPSEGKVLIDGVDIAEVNLRQLRRQMAVVTQQTVLFQGTIADNIAYARRHESMDRIVASAKTAFADEFIVTLPRGYLSTLGEDGSGLSGGQRQRIAIARAILRDPTILILDEATSQVDAESEAKIAGALREIRRGRTTLIIAHRLSTVIDADLIVVMQDGSIIDQGKHTELLQRCETYRRLTLTQM